MEYEKLLLVPPFRTIILRTLQFTWTLTHTTVHLRSRLFELLHTHTSVHLRSRLFGLLHTHICSSTLQTSSTWSAFYYTSTLLNTTSISNAWKWLKNFVNNHLPSIRQILLLIDFSTLDLGEALYFAGRV